MMAKTDIPAPVHPGEILREEFMEPFGLKAYTLAKNIGVARNTIESLSREKTGLGVETAFKLARFFGTTPDFWINIQKRYEMDVTRDKIGDELKNITPMVTA